jgi:hypothetical protein
VVSGRSLRMNTGTRPENNSMLASFHSDLLLLLDILIPQVLAVTLAYWFLRRDQQATHKMFRSQMTNFVEEAKAAAFAAGKEAGIAAAEASIAKTTALVEAALARAALDHGEKYGENE